MAPEGCAGILPIPRSSREHDAVAYLQTSRVQAMAECSGPPQPARTDALGTLYPSLEPVDSSTPHAAPLSRCTLLRRSSFVRAVCANECTYGSVRFVPWKLMEFSRLKWGPRQSLARSRV